MNFEPQKFFIGLMDFFTILLPGALFTYPLVSKLGPVVLGSGYYRLSDAGAWAAFLLASYLFGHLVFLLGSWLDDLIYEPARNRTLNFQIELLVRQDRLLPWFARFLIWLVFKNERNLALSRAIRIKEQAVAQLEAKDAINAFQWCKAWLNVEAPSSVAAVERLEADSKFFRSLAVVLVLLVPVWWHPDWSLHGNIIMAVLVLVLVLLALWRYMEQRFKATNQAYWSVITLMARNDKVSLVKAVHLAAGEPTHAGGVVYREQSGQRQYLLVEATDDPRVWVLPKGHIEEGEHRRETAVREVREETGIWGRIWADLGPVSYRLDGTEVIARFFLMEKMGRGLRRHRDAIRRCEWLSLAQAEARNIAPETRSLLQRVDRCLLQLAEIRLLGT